ncbi:hypothetical protein LHYA1_G006389 [Lachnellula hyalina]|uniref:DUF7514 domain-containing protein n=1 Tax=Lachnellula hyalina TaxID=1316788 RepID=A0A8H8TWN4_9HELO|nr:uncharacterized protein LHYA1_G006389 [Lachnellula hyalina]TVY24627.1 hypothetical protein LHYA1_G006389 [Lachnellula hyalina]
MAQQPVDAKAYYGYLFAADKKPTKVLDALLRGIAKHISKDVGDKDEKTLVPAKLASFYKAVGGNYDCCQHTLQPTSHDFEPPSIPALTTRGFVRWQSIEILLGPEEHVPFIQTAVREWAIKNPDTGETFPVELPKEAFPQKCDAEIEKWHSECAARLRRRASPDADDESMRPDLPPRPRVRVEEGYTHVHGRPSTRPRAGTDYSEPRSRVTSRPISYSHVPGTGARPVRPVISRSPSHRARQFLAPEESSRLSRSRRRSYPDNLNSPPSSPNSTSPQDLRPPPTPHHARRHSHPRQEHHQASVSSDASSEDDSPQSPKTKANTGAPRGRSHPLSSHSSNAGDGPSSRRFAPTVPTPAVPIPPDPRLRGRRERDEEVKRRSYPIPIDLTGKLSAPFLLGKRDPDRASRSGSRGGNKVSWKDLSEVQDLFKRGSKESSQDEELPRRSRDDYRRRDRDRERDRERDSLRPRDKPRRSSHDDMPRRDRERDRDRDRDREREPVGRDHRSFRDRDRERRAVSPIKGVSGRRYPEVS